MQLPAQLKPALWGAVAGAVLMAAGGFTLMGWKSGTAASEMARIQASEAVVAAMVPFCIAKAKQVPNSEAMNKFRAETSDFSRAQIVRSAGWATLDGATTPDYALASACSERLHIALK